LLLYFTSFTSLALVPTVCINISEWLAAIVEFGAINCPAEPCQIGTLYNLQPRCRCDIINGWTHLVVAINENKVTIVVELLLCETACLSHVIVWVTIPILTPAIAYCGCARAQLSNYLVGTWWSGPLLRMACMSPIFL
jgi:hypothetical protein